MTRGLQQSKRKVGPKDWVPRPHESAGLALRAAQAASVVLVGSVLARSLATEDFAVATLAISLVVLMSGVGAGGVSLLAQRWKTHECYPAGGAPAIDAEHLVPPLMLAWAFPLIAAGYFTYGLLPGSTVPAAILYRCAVASCFLAYSEALSGTIKGRGRLVSGQVLAASSMTLILLPAVLVAAVGRDFSASVVADGLVVASGSQALGALVVSRRCSSSTLLRANWFFSTQLASSLLRLSAVGAMGLLLAQVSVPLMGLMGSASDVGAFVVANQLALIGSFGLVVVNGFQAPIVASLAQEGSQVALQREARRACVVSASVGLLGFTVLAGFGGELVQSFYGNIDGASLPLLLGAANHLVGSMSGSVGMLLIGLGRESIVVRSQALGLTLLLVLLWVLVPRYGAVGGMTAILVANTSWKTMLVVEVYRRVGVLSLPLPGRVVMRIVR